MADSCCCCIDLEIEDSSLTLDVGGDSIQWGADEYVRVVTSDAEEYDGPYEATPTRETQVFPTTARLMTLDFTVSRIPYAEVTNESGGYTATIG